MDTRSQLANGYVYVQGIGVVSQRLYIRITMGADGKTPRRTLVVDGQEITELSVFETIEAALQFTSSIRWEPELQAKMKGNRRG